jgi:predicted flap endonuclease-1-like 5' DNA nuclease
MAERFTADLLFIIIALLIAALLGFLIGYFLTKSRYVKKCLLLDEEIAALQAKIRKLEDEKLKLQADFRRTEDEKVTLQSDFRKAEDTKLKLQADVRRMDDEIASLKLTIEKLQKESRLQTEQTVLKAAEVPHARVVADDLKVIIGIGPKIARLLINRGITTWKALSETSPSVITEILLKDGGERYRIHNPETWPHQAKLLNEGRWDELKELQSKIEIRHEAL